LSVHVDREVIEKCRSRKQGANAIALDDFVAGSDAPDASPSTRDWHHRHRPGPHASMVAWTEDLQAAA
jgi:hypothetical protein